MKNILQYINNNINYIVSEDSPIYIENFINDITDLNKVKVLPLNEQETYILRCFLEILDDKLNNNMINKIMLYINYKLADYFHGDISLQSTIYSLDIPYRYYNVLRRNNIFYLKDLVIYTEFDLKNIPYIGINGINIIKEELLKKGYSFTNEKDKLNKDALIKDIKELKLSSRVENTLRKNDIHLIGSLINIPYYDLCLIKPLGIVGRDELFNKLHEYNLYFRFELQSLDNNYDRDTELWRILPHNLYMLLAKNGIFKIDDILKLSRYTLEEILYLRKDDIDDLITKMHSLGFLFDYERMKEVYEEKCSKYDEELGYIVTGSRKLKK